MMRVPDPRLIQHAPKLEKGLDRVNPLPVDPIPRPSSSAPGEPRRVNRVPTLPSWASLENFLGVPPPLPQL
jgi:hypothetical protein